MRRKCFSTLLAILPIVMIAHIPSRAATVDLDEYIMAGFSVIRMTAVPVGFTGCARSAVVTLADGTRFVCGRRMVATGYNPTVYILQNDSHVPSVILIGGRAYTGALLQFGQHNYAVPQPLIDEAPPAPVAADDPFSANLRQVEPIRSINALEAEDTRRLNDAQAQPPVLPSAHAQTNRSR